MALGTAHVALAYYAVKHKVVERLARWFATKISDGALQTALKSFCMPARLQRILLVLTLISGTIHCFVATHIVRYLSGGRAKPSALIMLLVAFNHSPLTALWRFLTVPFRVTPDLMILGQARGGTTTTARYLEQFPGAHQPYTYLKTEFINNKESLYFSGVYARLINPVLYKMVFPTIFEKWWCQLRGKPFFAYDASATSLTAPWVPAMMKKVNPNMKFIVCLREPISQNVSWYNFEKALVAEFVKYGAKSVPAKDTMRDAWEYSISEETNRIYNEGENITGNFLTTGEHGMFGIRQSGALSQMGNYVHDLNRYLKHFDLSQFTFINQTEDLSAAGSPDTIRRMAGALPRDAAACVTEDVVADLSKCTLLKNANTKRCPSSSDPVLIAEMQKYYAPLNKELESMIGRNLKWDYAPTEEQESKAY